ncbi:Uncharacterised protein [Mycobacteroides abscessus subsp. abscessus]|nr:Uncharacterised protein [Mycobacteroides abscessus subsp. abscessus]
MPASVVTRIDDTSSPSAFAVVSRTARSLRGRVKSMRIHCPTADDSPLLAHAVDASPSNAAAGELAGDVWPGWVASDAEPDVETDTSPGALSRSHCPSTRGWPSTG